MSSPLAVELLFCIHIIQITFFKIYTSFSYFCEGQGPIINKDYDVGTELIVLYERNREDKYPGSKFKCYVKAGQLLNFFWNHIYN